MSTATQRDTHETWLKQLTLLPTAAGCEQRIIRWIEHWVAERPNLVLHRDDAGNLIINQKVQESNYKDTSTTQPKPLVITAHLDHPAFVVEHTPQNMEIELSFRGGVGDSYFTDARITIFNDEDQSVSATLVDISKPQPFRECTARVDASTDPEMIASLRPGDVGVWELPAPKVENGLLHSNACDDLAGVAAALSAIDQLRQQSGAAHVSVLFTRAEEIGFIGATAACKLGTIPTGVAVIALENSRSFAESPIGGGPIVRVGDKMSTFNPTLNANITHVAAQLAEHDDSFTFQRKLMPGGTCEATVFCAFGYEATCVCLPLGNYHNQAELESVETDANTSPARVGLEIISISDFHKLVELLIACGTSLSEAPPMLNRIEKLYVERAFVLDQPDEGI